MPKIKDMKPAEANQICLTCHNRADHPEEIPELPDEVFTAVVGAVNELVSDRVRKGRTAELLELEPVISYLQIAFLAGHSEAAGEL